MNDIKEKLIPLIKDAAILFAITIIAGVLLAFTYDKTKKTIEKVEQEHIIHAYEKVLSVAATFSEYRADLSYSLDDDAARLEAVAIGRDKNGTVCGFVITTSALGYGGKVKVAVGIDMNEVVTGIAFPETLPETPGLGQKATDESFYGQFAGKKVDKFKVIKGDASEDSEIAAISGATKTSNAVVEAVNLAKVIAKRAIEGIN